MESKVIQCQLEAASGNYREIQTTYCVSTPGNQAATQEESGSNSKEPEESPPNNNSGINCTNQAQSPKNQARTPELQIDCHNGWMWHNGQDPLDANHRTFQIDWRTKEHEDQPFSNNSWPRLSVTV